MGNVFSEEAKFELYTQQVKSINRFARSDEKVIESYKRTTNFEFLDQMLYVYTKQWLPDDLLLKADKMTMANSLELREPFLDPEVFAVASALRGGRVSSLTASSHSRCLPDRFWASFNTLSRRPSPDRPAWAAVWPARSDSSPGGSRGASAGRRRPAACSTA